MVVGLPTKPPKAPKNAQSAVVALQAMAVTEGWAFILKINQTNIDILTQQILDRVDENKQVISEQEVDLLRAKRGYLLELSQLPEKFIAAVELGASVTEVNFDPYQSAEELIASRKK